MSYSEMGVFNSKINLRKDMQKMNKIENPHLQKIKKFVCILKKFESKNIFSIAQDFWLMLKSTIKKKSISMHVYAFLCIEVKKQLAF